MDALKKCPFLNCNEEIMIEKTFGQTMSGTKHSKPYYVIVHIGKKHSIRMAENTRSKLIKAWNTRTEADDARRGQNQ